MKSLFFVLSLVVPVFLMSGCSSSEGTNVIADASQEELDNYEKLLAEAEQDLSSDEASGELGE